MVIRLDPRGRLFLAVSTMISKFTCVLPMKVIVGIQFLISMAAVNNKSKLNHRFLDLIYELFLMLI